MKRVTLENELLEVLATGSGRIRALKARMFPHWACCAIPVCPCFGVTSRLRSSMYEPGICLIAQGSNRVIPGDDTYVYDASHYLITAVHLSMVVQIVEASKERPYLGLRLQLDQREISQLMVDGDLPLPRMQQPRRGRATGGVTLPLLAAFQVGYVSAFPFSRELAGYWVRHLCEISKIYVRYLLVRVHSLGEALSLREVFAWIFGNKKKETVVGKINQGVRQMFKQKQAWTDERLDRLNKQQELPTLHRPVADQEKDSINEETAGNLEVET